MNAPTSCLYAGHVAHRRVHPVRHGLRYKVFSLFVDVDQLSVFSGKLKLFSYNRFNFFSVSDRHHGNGTSISEHVWSLVRQSPGGTDVRQIFMLAYPALLGRVFNPLTTYYAYNTKGYLCLMIYEVNNTFGERHSYVIPFDGTTQQSHAKQFYVSPFNAVEGRYMFSAPPPGNDVTLGVALHVGGKPVMQAWFTGQQRQLSDAQLLRLFFTMPLQPAKVILGIHWEALKLWLKGLPLVARPKAVVPNFNIAQQPNTGKETLA